MNQQKRPIFRDHALQHYMQKRENDVLPHIVSPPVFLFVWLLFGLIMLAGFIAWMVRVPTYASGSGIVYANDHRVNAQQNEFDALIFVPASVSKQLREGLHGVVQVESLGQSFDSTVKNTEPTVYSPEAAQSHYKLSCNAVQAINGPSVALRMQVLVPANAHVQNGTSLNAQVQVGSQRVLAFFPLVNQLTGGN